MAKMSRGATQPGTRFGEEVSRSTKDVPIVKPEYAGQYVKGFSHKGVKLGRRPRSFYDTQWRLKVTKPGSTEWIEIHVDEIMCEDLARRRDTLHTTLDAILDKMEQNEEFQKSMLAEAQLKDVRFTLKAGQNTAQEG